MKNWKTTSIGGLQMIASFIPIAITVLSGNMPTQEELGLALLGIGSFAKGWHTADVK